VVLGWPNGLDPEPVDRFEQSREVTANDGAEALLPEDFLTHLVIHPSRETRERSQVFEPLPPRIMRPYNSLTPT
jgi:hypothetical protein